MKFFWGGRCNATLGGACYIHLTMGTNAVFSGFSGSFGYGKPYLWNQPLSWWIICFLFWLYCLLCQNRTLNWFFFHSSSFNHSWVLGGPRYIHLTKGTNAVFSGFSAFWASAAMFMNPITFVMNCSCYYILILAFLQTLKSCCVSLNGLHLVAP